MVQASALVGSGGQKKPCSARASWRAWLVTPGSTRAMRLAASISRMRSMRSSDSTSSPFKGTVAPVVPVPRPRGISARSASLQSLTSSRTCSCSVANATAWGRPWRRLLSYP